MTEELMAVVAHIRPALRDVIAKRAQESGLPFATLLGELVQSGVECERRHRAEK